jgi:SAM-dependent methyltransferase
MEMRVEEQHERALDAAGGQYEAVPYPSMPYAFTQPAHLSALGALFGLKAPCAEGARVLELGCAAGGNIIPLAARMPSARFVGIDLSHTHIEEGRRHVEAFGLKNIELRQGDLARVQLEDEQFDYIICHGVYSWVPSHVQQAILRICQESLAPQGMALISYNVLPGWHLRQVVRDACRRYAGKDGSPMARVARAREVLARLGEAASEHELYGKIMRFEARHAPQRPASYILSEMIADPHQPCYFEDFAHAAQARGLMYLCEADLAASTPEIFKPAAMDALDALAGESSIEFEQAVDYLTGRCFRRSVLVREGRATQYAQQASPERLEELYFSGAFRAQPQGDTGEASFIDRRGRAVAARDPAVLRILCELAGRFPGTASYCDLLAAATNGADDAAEAQRRMCKALMLLINVGQVEISTRPLIVGSAQSAKPRAWWLAREEAGMRRPFITTMRHESVRLHPVMSFLLPRLDGQHDREMLVARVEEALALGLLQLPDEEGRAAASQRRDQRKDAQQYVEAALQYLAVHALFEADVP